MQAVARRPKGDRYYDNAAFRYEKKRRRQEWWHVEQREMQSLLGQLPKGLSVVDIPFGTGRFVPYYLERGFQVSGLDASKDMLLAAQKALGDQYKECTCVTGSADALPYSDAQFDLVVSTRFLRDIIPFADAKKMLTEMARVTSRYAIIQLGENSFGHRMPDADEVMASSMSRYNINALLKANGLQPVDRRLVHTLEEGEEIYHILCERF